MTARLVVLASGEGTTLQAILDAVRDPAYGATVVAVGTDRHDVPALDRAVRAGVATFTVRLEDCRDRQQFDDRTAASIAVHAPDLLVLAGYMKILGAAVVERFPTVNTHPSLLPRHPGSHAVRQALDAGDTESGATVHWVDQGVDTGPVLAQVAVPVRPDDTESTLRARIQAAERPLYIDTIGRLARRSAKEPAP